MNEFIAAVIGAVGGGVVAFFTTRWQIRKELEYEYDKDLRERRIKAYLELWKLLQPLAKYSRPIEDLRVSHLSALSKDLRGWYFETGGFLLSSDARDLYFDVQEALAEVLAAAHEEEAGISDSTFESLRAKGSNLRTSLVKDVGTSERNKEE